MIGIQMVQRKEPETKTGKVCTQNTVRRVSDHLFQSTLDIFPPATRESIVAGALPHQRAGKCKFSCRTT